MGLYLEDGTKKIFLNMSSKNGSPELVSLLQYMKETSMDNPEIQVMDERIVKLDRIVNEVKQSEEWEAVKMNILEIGEERGRENKLVEQICRKLQKGKNAAQIAAELEEDIDYVEEICKAAENAAPDYDPRVVYRIWKRDQ